MNINNLKTIKDLANLSKEEFEEFFHDNIFNVNEDVRDYAKIRATLEISAKFKDIMKMDINDPLAEELEKQLTEEFLNKDIY